MNVCIVTVYDSINAGSFWQAYTLGDTIMQMGHTVCYRKRMGGFLTKSIKSVAVATLKHGIKQGFFSLKNIPVFWHCQKKLSIADNDTLKNQVDVFVLGSDTIWNMDVRYFRKNYKAFWGIGLNPEHTVVYAASMANTGSQILKSYPDIQGVLSRWMHIGVRDTQTMEAIRPYVNGSVEKVCDPTLLKDLSFYQSFVQRPRTERYIFLYLFTDLTEKQRRELRQIADKNALKIITTFGKISAYDGQVLYAPLVFLANILHADYVITDTFHGTAFSVNLEKQFVILDRGKNKVNDLLKMLDFSDRSIAGDAVGSGFLFDQQIDYGQRRGALERFRNSSLDYLKRALEQEHENQS